jgi:UDP-glucose 4-epimerase
MHVIVFGGSGFLGSHVADALSESGHQVRIFDVRRSEYLRPTQEMIIGDILDEQSVNEAIQGIDIVYNFAGIADIDEASRKPIETVRYNILGNTILLDAARSEAVKRFIYASTVYVYSDSGSFYRCSKAACENYIETYQKQYGLNYTILRYGTLYGTRADSRNSIYRFIKEAMTEEKIAYPGDGNEIREYISVLDAAKASVEILADEFKNECIIFTGHYPMKIRDMLTMVKEMLKKDIKIEFVAPKSQDPIDHYTVTPYTFIPKVGKKYVKHLYTDMGQGLLLCMQEIYDQIQEGKVK